MGPQRFLALPSPMPEISTINVLVLMAFGLLVIVTGGVAYLTLADWRDRRRQDNERRQARRR
ncbi:MAG: hypothetical protein NZ772_15570 [Cyanobacteria bacterium]|nr:hypothetical protein [Cyanobacteriota bacterium]MDW8202755.1 hypothetical protein [Cyanobacteriota bacterium SKYGB_h_bin112]